MSAATGRVVRIGGASGAWGDSPGALGQLLAADVGYLMMDYLAEVTMSLLARARMKNPEFGFPPDFVTYLAPHLPEIARRGVRVVTNAGGVNPMACKRAIEAAAQRLGVTLTVAAVEGDDLMPHLDRLRACGIREAETGAPIPERLLTANAYLGALPIAAALAGGADIVVTGRAADSALALGILMHEFGWLADDHDLMAAGSLVGHVLECGPQATGGTFTDWQDVPDWERIGYPIADCHPDGSFVLSKPAGTGGLISFGTTAEQILYEIGDPAAYVLPDVIADFSWVTVTETAPDQVRVSGARGRGPTRNYKVSATWQDGYRAVATVSIVGPDAVAKALRTADALLARSRHVLDDLGLPDFTAVRVEPLGAESAYGPATRATATREVLLRVVVDHPDRGALEHFAREVGSIGLSFAPGTTGIFSGRPKPVPLVRLFTMLVPKDLIPPPTLSLGQDAARPVSVPVGGAAVPESDPALSPGDPPDVGAETDARATRRAPLRRLAYARSGDKGNRANIAIIARSPDYVPFLRRVLTADRMLSHFAHQVEGPVRRFEAPGLSAFNFLIDNALGGGGMASMRIDPQGKAYGQMALEMELDIPVEWISPGDGAA